MANDTEWEQLVAKAKAAMNAGCTRGRFIRENSTKSDDMLYLQLLSDAYSEAMAYRVSPK